MSKCEMYVYGGSKKEQATTKSMVKRIFPKLAFLTNADLLLLGAPILEDAFPSTLQEKTRQAELMATRLAKLGAHHAVFLLKNCLFLPKLLYILRCSPVWKFPGLLRNFDEVLRSSVVSITNTKMTDSVWRQTSLPIVKGGLGLRRAEEIALPAYLASIFSAKRLVSSMVADFDVGALCAAEQSAWVEQSGVELPMPELRVHQRLWDQPIVQKHFLAVVAS
ncbi:hypothetical protein RvY_15350 [Ramazzottius varieornatus]|uniref:Uncharacterized protein n=1 Tax=Ramazzottius varieornatus TaxID=947166 RepID=A0A1D1VUL7_RAMVA|nr:hypothetical protein RvY_15350 [Ramazzottius varieornatus]